MSVTERDSTMADLKGSARLVSAGVWGGLISGFLIGGVGGRLAMLILRLTSDAGLHGLETDDGFVIGQISGDTIFLLAVTTVLGLAGGIIYLVIRDWLPERRRPLLMAVFYGAVGGAVVIRQGGLDFTVLDPLPLAIAFFVVIPAAYGAFLSYLAERFAVSASSARDGAAWKAFVPLLGLLVAGPFGLAALALIGAVWGLTHKSDLLRFWSSPAMTLVGRVVLVAVTGLGLVDIVRDAAAIL